MTINNNAGLPPGGSPTLSWWGGLTPYGELSGLSLAGGLTSLRRCITLVTDVQDQRRVIRDRRPRATQSQGSPLSGGGARPDQLSGRDSVHEMANNRSLADPARGPTGNEGRTNRRRGPHQRTAGVSRPGNRSRPDGLSGTVDPTTATEQATAGSVRRPSIRQLRGNSAEAWERAVVCWTPHFEGDQDFWVRIQRCMNEGSLCNRIRKITSVKQKNHLCRFDLWVERGFERAVLERVKRHQHKWGWHCREHIAYEVRAARGRNGLANRGSQTCGPDSPHRTEQQGRGNRRRNGASASGSSLSPGSTVGPTSGPRVGTLNINGVREKKKDLQFYLEERGIHCLALQETLLRVTDWSLRIPGYHCFTTCGEHGASVRGVSMLVHKSMNGYVVGKGSPWHICVRVTGGGLRRPWVLCSVYIPSLSKGKASIEHLVQDLNKVCKDFPNDSIVLMGDWNRDEAEVDKLIRRFDDHFRVLPLLNGEDGTRKGPSKRRIDLMVARLKNQSSAEDPVVDKMLDISDHYPVYSRLEDNPEHGQAIAAARNRRHTALDRRRIYPEDIPVQGSSSWRRGAGKATHFNFVSSNFWAPLQEESDEDNSDDQEAGKDNVQATADGMAEEWIKTVHKATEAAGMASTKGNGKAGLARKLRRAIKRRTDLYQEACNSEKGTEGARTLWAAYDEARTQARELVRKDKRDRWNKALGKAADDMRNNPRDYWRWAAGLGGWKRKEGTSGVQPIRHPDTGEILTHEGAIRDAWATHFERLAADPTGNSRERTKWRAWMDSSPHQHMEQLDSPISVEEIEDALGKMKRHKAPGADGIPADLLKLAGLGEDNSFLCTIHRLINYAFRQSVIPEAWCKSVVIAIPKKGDPMDMNNYRGISLMNTVLKLLMIVLSGRLNNAFEAGGLFSQAQAGFRKSEECMTQVACLLELCRRRQLENRPTYLTFVDLKKAYDTVPHEALMAKLHFYGVRGRTLSFIRELYRRSSIVVRCGDGMTEPVPLKRGVRQGCPLSPVLFNVFINDILNDADAFGIPLGARRIPGLLFADDLVCLAPNRRKMRRMHAHLTTWLIGNEMSVGIKKCGAMVIGRDHERLSSRPDRWTLEGQQIPIVEEYTYLGINFHRDLSTSSMMRGRLQGARKLVRAMAPFMLKTSIPLPMKVAVIKAVVHPRLLYGAEVYGMNKRVTSAMQTYLNQVCRLAIGLHRSSIVSNVALWRELDLPPVCASAAAKRARAIRKSFQLSTYVAQVVRTPFKNTHKTWLTGGVWWIRRYLHGMARKYPALVRHANPNRVFASWREGGELGDQDLKQSVLDLIWRREEDAAVSAAGSRYVEAEFDKYRLTSVQAVGCPWLSLGFAALVRMRLESVWTCDRLADVGLLPGRYRTRCPCCKKDVPESVPHMLLDCVRWKDGRDVLLGDLVAVAHDRWRLTSSVVCQRRMVTLLLGGRVQGEPLSNWNLDGTTPGTRVPPSRGPSGAGGSGGGARGGFMVSPWILSRGVIRVASYLDWMMRERSFIIREVRARHGLSLTATILSPNG